MRNTVSAGTPAPVILKRPAEERGQTELGWLHSRHTFSFGEYYDPDHMGFATLRVINDDIVEPGQGFGTHAHRDAEIFSYVIEGELEHKDSLGHGSVIQAGNLQYISAGSGIRHSEFNPSRTNRVHFLQIWLLPNTSGGQPRYAEKTLGNAAKNNVLTLLFARQPRAETVAIRQDAEIYFGKLDQGKSLATPLDPEHYAWLHLIQGRVRLFDETLKGGDGIGVSHATTLDIHAQETAEFLLFKMV